jgi:hypothetical protein
MLNTNGLQPHRFGSAKNFARHSALQLVAEYGIVVLYPLIHCSVQLPH